METVIITGADGFIGSHLVKRFDRAGIKVWAIVHPESPTKRRLQETPNIHVVESTIENLPRLASLFPHGADAFYHFAWQGVNALDRNDLPLQMGNIGLGLTCINFAANIGCRKVIFPGSTSEYLYCGKPIDGEAIPSPMDAYGSVKVALRYLASQAARRHSLNFIYVVITGIYAPDRKDNNVISYTIEKLLKGEQPSLTRLEQLWDYVSIDDATEALLLTGEHGRNEAFYAIGHGDNWPLRKYIEIIHDLIDPAIPLGIGKVEYKRGTLPSSCVNLEPIKKDTGFIPKVSFSEGIVDVIEQMRKEMENGK